MLKNTPIIILDEATAFADPDNETRVQAAFSKLSQGKTVIMIAHRPFHGGRCRSDLTLKRRADRRERFQP